jgi:hypothetical protein
MRYAVLGMLILFALGDGCSPTPGVVGVQDYGQVTGRVLDAMTNRPIANALVSVGSLYASASDANGAFVLGKVPAGDQTVTARAPGYSTASADTTVDKNKIASVGYVRLVPLIRPEGQPTLAPPPTPTPVPVVTATPEPTQPPAPGIAPTPGGQPSVVPSATPAAVQPSVAPSAPAAATASPLP